MNKKIYIEEKEILFIKLNNISNINNEIKKVSIDDNSTRIKFHIEHVIDQRYIDIITESNLKISSIFWESNGFLQVMLRRK